MDSPLTVLYLPPIHPLPLLAAKMVGSHVVAVRPLYGGTDHLLASGLLGLEVSWAVLVRAGRAWNAFWVGLRPFEVHLGGVLGFRGLRIGG